MEDRVLLYNCCDDMYFDFIPLYCASALFSNNNIDIEIGINKSTLPHKIESVLSELRNTHKDSEINLKYDFFKTITGGRTKAIYNGQRMWVNTVRFVSMTEIKNKYTYINDIDIVMLMRNFYNYHINIMEQYETDYSNWVRTDDKLCLTGLHFVKTKSFYPQKIEGINLSENDEHILKKIQSHSGKINENIPRRPLCGLHFSINQNLQAQLKLCKEVVNELNSYKQAFFDFINSDEYNIIKDCNNNIINKYIEDFKRYYNNLQV